MTGEQEAEVIFWRQEMAAKLDIHMRLAIAAEERGEEREAAIHRCEVNVILNAFRDAYAGEWHERCCECGEFILPGTLTVTVGDEDDIASAHAEHFPGLHGFPQGNIDVAATIAEARKFMGRADAR